MAVEGQSDRRASDMEVHMKQRCVIEFLHAETTAPIDICWTFLETKQWMWAQWVVWISAVVTVTVGHLCRWRFPWAQQAGSCSLLAKMQTYWQWQCWKIVLRSWEFCLSNNVIVLFLSIVISREINGRYYFQNNLCFDLLSLFAYHTSWNYLFWHFCAMTYWLNYFAWNGTNSLEKIWQWHCSSHRH